MVFFFIFYIFLTFGQDTNEVSECLIKNCSESVQQPLEIFLDPHSHLDAFWLQTYDEYLYGNGTDPIHANKNVSLIFDHVLYSLYQNPTRQYVMSEVCFIKPWYEALNEDNKSFFKKLIKNGQIEILNGGWVQNDEALSNFNDIIDQLTLGHLFLNNSLEYNTKVGYNIDSFGHSMIQAAIYSQMGFDSNIIARVDTEDIKQRAQRGALEFTWEPIQSTGVFKDSIFTHIRYKRHGTSPWIQPQISSYNCDKFKKNLRKFEEDLKKYGSSYNQSNILYFIGDDFMYFDVKYYEAMDMVINYYNNNKCKNINLHYGKIQDYFNKTKNKQSPLEVKKFDFIPLWEDGLYWTGFYTSSPQYKLAFKEASRYLYFIRKIYTQALLSSTIQYNQVLQDSLTKLQEEISLAQHHDGIPSTSKYRVMDDVVFRINKAIKNLSVWEFVMFNQIFQQKNQNTITNLDFKQCTYILEDSQKYFCKEFLEKYDQFLLAVYNTQKEQFYQLEIDLPNDKFYQIYYNNKTIVKGQVICKTNTCKLIFDTYLYGQQFNYFTVLKQDRNNLGYYIYEYQPIIFKDNIQVFKLENGFFYYNLTIFPDMKNFEINKTNIENQFQESYKFQISLEYYDALYELEWSNGMNQPYQAHPGKYAMKNTNDRYIYADPKQIRVLVSQDMIELEIEYTRYIYQTIRFQPVKSNDYQVQFDILTNWDKQLENVERDYVLVIKEKSIEKQDFYVDANGLIMVQRKLFWREDYIPVYNRTDRVVGNYFPMTSCAKIEDKSIRMIIFTDRPQGVTSLGDGEIEINIERIAGEDYLGVGEELKNFFDHQFKHHLIFNSKTIHENFSIFEEYNNWDEKPFMFLANITENIQLQMTKQEKRSSINQLKITPWPLQKDIILLRIQNINELSSLDIIMNSQLDSLFHLVAPNIQLKLEVNETLLNGINSLADHLSKNPNITLDTQIYNGSNNITILPRQIRTFMVKVNGYQFIQDEDEEGKHFIEKNNQIEKQKQESVKLSYQQLNLKRLRNVQKRVVQ